MPRKPGATASLACSAPYAPIVGGLGTIFGPVVGAFILTPLGELLTTALEKLGVNAPGAKALFYGLTLMSIIFVRPDGFVTGF